MDGVRKEDGKEYRIVFRGTKEQSEQILRNLREQGIDAKFVKRDSGAHDIYEAAKKPLLKA